MAAASGDGEGEIHVVEVAEESSSADEISPLLAVEGANNKPPRMTIFSVSCPRRKPPNVQNLPVSYAVLLNFATPIMASIGAMIILQEKLSLSHIGGLTCSFIGLLLILQPILLSKGSLTETFQMDTVVTDRGKDVIFSIFVGIFSTILGGVSYCLIRAGAMASDQPVYTVFSFAILACPLSAICILIFQEFVLPNLFTFLLMMVLGVLAFYAEILLARGLQLERIAKVTNIQYIKVLLWQLWSMTFLGAAPSSYKLIGCLLILASVCGTAYMGPEKENE